MTESELRERVAKLSDEDLERLVAALETKKEAI